MPKTKGSFTQEQWDAVPMLFGSKVMAEIVDCGMQYVQRHGDELGGQKVAGKWLFTKAATAKMLGIEE